MPGKVPDEDLRTGLTQARKKPRHYVLIAKGTTAVKLIVQKKLIKAGDIQKAKTEAKGSLVLEGVCQGDGPEMVFQVVGEEPSVKTMTIKELIAEQTELTLKARFQVVQQLAEVDENDENEQGEVDAEQTNTGNVPEAPPAPPPPQTNNPDPAIAQLLAAMNKLSPVIQAAAKNNPNRRDELLKGVALFQTQIKESNAENAKNTLLAVGKLAKELAAANPQEVNPEAPVVSNNNDSNNNQAGQVDQQAEAWNKAWAVADAAYQAAIKTAPDDVASKMRVIHAYAFEQAEAGQYAKALAALERLRPLIQQAGQGKGAKGEVAAGTVEKRKFMLERFKVLPTEIRPSLDKLHVAITARVPNEDADELCQATEEALNVLFDSLRDEIDTAITAGDMSLLAGVKARLTNDALVKHLFNNPLVDGSPFQDVVLSAIDEVEAKLAS